MRTVPTLALLLLAAACGDPRREAEPPAGPDLDPPGARWRQHEELRADLDAPRHPSDGGGSGRVVELDGRALGPGEGAVVRAGERHGFVLEFTVGPEGIAEGGAIYLMPEPFWGWSGPQNVDPTRLGFVRFEAEDVELEVPPQRAPLIAATVRGRALAAGEVVRIEYGAASGALVDLYAERGSRLWLSVDGDGDGVRKVVEDSPRVDVRARPATRIVAHLPSRVPPGEPVELVLAVLDEAGNVVDDARGTFSLEGRDEELLVEPEDRGAGRLTLVPEAEGVERLQVRFDGAGGEVFTCETNPMVVRAGARPLLWADLHGHSQVSDGTGTPEDYLRYARDVAGLDVVALTDHDHFGVRFLDRRDDLWDGIQEVTARYHEPGRFVTLLGMEWTSWVHGHRHVLWFGDEGEPISSLDPHSDTPAELWDILRGQDALTLAHHSAGEPVPVNWTFPPDPELEPVTEVMSVHGSSEAADSPSVVRGARPGNFVRDVLDRGHRLGLVGSGDSHDGHPGLPHLNPMYGYLAPRGGRGASLGQGGLAAIEAEPERLAVLEALRARRCYATSGPRIVLEVELAGHGPGQSLTARDEAELVVSVVPTERIERIDLVRSGEVVHSWRGGPGRGALVRQALSDLRGGEYVYVRVVQEDRGLAWSSPIFVDP